MVYIAKSLAYNNVILVAETNGFSVTANGQKWMFFNPVKLAIYTTPMRTIRPCKLYRILIGY